MVKKRGFPFLGVLFMVLYIVMIGITVIQTIRDNVLGYLTFTFLIGWVITLTVINRKRIIAWVYKVPKVGYILSLWVVALGVIFYVN